MKIIKYKFLAGEVNHGTEENPSIEKFFSNAQIECKTQDDFEANYLIAEKEAVPGTIEVKEE